MAGKKDCMVGIVSNKPKYTPLKKAISEVKDVDPALVKMAEVLAI